MAAVARHSNRQLSSMDEPLASILAEELFADSRIRSETFEAVLVLDGLLVATRTSQVSVDVRRAEEYVTLVEKVLARIPTP